MRRGRSRAGLTQGERGLICRKCVLVQVPWSRSAPGQRQDEWSPHLSVAQRGAECTLRRLLKISLLRTSRASDRERLRRNARRLTAGVPPARKSGPVHPSRTLGPADKTRIYGSCPPTRVKSASRGQTGKRNCSSFTFQTFTSKGRR